MVWFCTIPAEPDSITRDPDGCTSFATGIPGSFRSLSGSPLIRTLDDGTEAIVGVVVSESLSLRRDGTAIEHVRTACPIPPIVADLARAGRLWLPVIDADGTRIEPGIPYPGTPGSEARDAARRSRPGALRLPP